MRALSIGKDNVVVGPTYLPSTTNQTTTLPADTVVFVSLNHSNRDLYDVLAGGKYDLRVVGDANSARPPPPAVHEGHMAGAAV